MIFPRDRLSQFYLACLAGLVLVAAGVVALHYVGDL